MNVFLFVAVIATVIVSAHSSKWSSEPEENWLVNQKPIWAPEKQTWRSEACEDTRTLVQYQSMQLSNMQTLVSLLANKIGSLKLQGYQNGWKKQQPIWMKEGDKWSKGGEGDGGGGRVILARGTVAETREASP